MYRMYIHTYVSASTFTCFLHTHVHMSIVVSPYVSIFLYTPSSFFPLTSLHFPLSFTFLSFLHLPPTPTPTLTLPFRYLIGVFFCMLSGLLLLALAVCLVLGCVAYERIPQTRNRKARHMKRCFRL